ncbi:Protein of unknown function [Pyronema omphalodes CBS 100304]|uniref:Uncharacterized protein n=1 Tax=Pyronema omphalodes (strain CBS 100304) TaxID=1076935 RepID=U4LUD5_PYROM|nr:Protein of unknown function [Pyronema omphalodes CBS 100304]
MGGPTLDQLTSSGGLDWIHYSPVNPVLPSNHPGVINQQDSIRPCVAPLKSSPAPVSGSGLGALARTSPLAPPQQQQDQEEQPMALIVTFATQSGVEQFKSYTDKHGIWVLVQHPQRGLADNKMVIEGVEYPIFKESHRGILYAKKNILGAKVRVYKGLEGMFLQWYKMEDGSGLKESRDAEATRVIEVQGDSGTIERKITAMKCSIELIKITSGGGCPYLFICVCTVSGMQLGLWIDPKEDNGNKVFHRVY